MGGEPGGEETSQEDQWRTQVMVCLLFGNSFLLHLANPCFPKRGDVAQSAPRAALPFPAAAHLWFSPLQIRPLEFAKPWVNIAQERSSHSKSVPHMCRKHSPGMVVGGWLQVQPGSWAFGRPHSGAMWVLSAQSSSWHTCKDLGY